MIPHHEPGRVILLNPNNLYDIFDRQHGQLEPFDQKLPELINSNRDEFTPLITALQDAGLLNDDDNAYDNAYVKFFMTCLAQAFSSIVIDDDEERRVQLQQLIGLMVSLFGRINCQDDLIIFNNVFKLLEDGDALVDFINVFVDERGNINDRSNIFAILDVLNVFISVQNFSGILGHQAYAENLVAVACRLRDMEISTIQHVKHVLQKWSDIQNFVINKYLGYGTWYRQNRLVVSHSHQHDRITPLQMAILKLQIDAVKAFADCKENLMVMALQDFNQRNNSFIFLEAFSPVWDNLAVNIEQLTLPYISSFCIQIESCLSVTNPQMNTLMQHILIEATEAIPEIIDCPPAEISNRLDQQLQSIKGSFEEVRNNPVQYAQDHNLQHLLPAQPSSGFFAGAAGAAGARGAPAASSAVTTPPRR